MLSGAFANVLTLLMVEVTDCGAVVGVVAEFIEELLVCLFQQLFKCHLLWRT